MADPLGGDIFDNEALAEAEIEKLLKQVKRVFISYGNNFHMDGG